MNWDRYSIFAAIKRKNKALTELSKEHGLDASACQKALNEPWPAAEKIISDFLGVPEHTLWPERFTIKNGDITRLPKKEILARQKGEKPSNDSLIKGDAA